MIPVPDGWLTAANDTHAPEWAVDLVAADGTPMRLDIPFIDGTFEQDPARKSRLSVDVPADPSPQLLHEDFLPLGHRLRARYRINGSDTWITAADCDLVASALARPEDTWTLAAVDQTHRMDLDDLARGGFAIIGGETVAQVIDTLIRRTFPAAVVDITGRCTTELFADKAEWAYDTGSPWTLAQALAVTCGAIAWQDASTRIWYVRDVTTDDPAVDALAVGEGGQITGYTVRHEMSYNRSIATWIDDQPQPNAVVGSYTDNRPDSPSAFGRIGTYVVAESVTRDVPPDNMPSQARADNAAAVLILAGNARMRQVEVRHPVRPWLQVGDYVDMTYLGGPTAERQRIASIGYGLTRDSIQVTRMQSGEYTVTPLGGS